MHHLKVVVEVLVQSPEGEGQPIWMRLDNVASCFVGMGSCQEPAIYRFTIRVKREREDGVKAFDLDFCRIDRGSEVLPVHDGYKQQE